MSRQTELAKNTAILTFGKICTQFVQFLLLPLYTALLEPEEFGVVDLFNTYVILLVPLFNWQFDQGLFRFLLDCREAPQQQKTIFSTVMVANAAQTALYLTFYLIAGNYIHSEYKVFLAIDVAANIFLNSFMQFSRGIGRNSSYAIASFFSVSSTVVLNIVFIVGFQMGALGMFLAMAISKCLTIVYLVLADRVWRYFSVTAFSKGSFEQIFKYSMPLVPNALSWWVVSASNRTIISSVLSVAANGVFSVASKFSGVFITVYNVFNMAWTESASLHLNDEDRDSFLTQTINMVFSLFASVCIVLIAAMPFVFPLMVDPQYGEAYEQIPILLLAVLFQVLVGLYGVVYVAMKKSGQIAKTSMIVAAINLGLDIILIRFLGLYAASLATLVAYATMAIYRYFDVQKYVNAKLSAKTLVSIIPAGVVVFASYYINHIVVNMIVLFLAIVYVVLINRNFIKTIMDTVVTISKKMMKR